MKIEFDSRIPLYYQIIDLIEDKIRTEEWLRGSQIPTEKELCDFYGVSRITIRKAIEELTRSNRLIKIQGKGTFVAEQPIKQTLGSIYSFSQEMEKQGKISSTRIISAEIVEADEKLSQRLNLNVGSKVIELKRLRLASEKPVMYERTYFDYNRYHRLLEYDLNKYGLYNVLQNQLKIKSTKAEERFRACELTTNEAKLLECEPYSYGLVVQRTLYQNDEVVCWSSLVSKGDSFEFNVVLNT